MGIKRKFLRRPKNSIWKSMLAVGMFTSALSVPLTASAEIVRVTGETFLNGDKNTANIYAEHVNAAAGVGMNTFKKFDVNQNQVANIMFKYKDESHPTLNTVVNMVQSQINISGTVNAIRNNKIGGSMVFMSPKGMVVSATGVINTGSLTVMTPTEDFFKKAFYAKRTIGDTKSSGVISGEVYGEVDKENTVDIFQNINSDDAAAVAQYRSDMSKVMGLQGAHFANGAMVGFDMGNRAQEIDFTIPISGDGNIVVQGKINAATAIKLQAASIDVAPEKDAAGNPIKDAQNNVLKPLLQTGVGFQSIVNVDNTLKEDLQGSLTSGEKLEFKIGSDGKQYLEDPSNIVSGQEFFGTVDTTYTYDEVVKTVTDTKTTKKEEGKQDQVETKTAEKTAYILTTVKTSEYKQDAPVAAPTTTGAVTPSDIKTEFETVRKAGDVTENGKTYHTVVPMDSSKETYTQTTVKDTAGVVNYAQIETTVKKDGSDTVQKIQIIKDLEHNKEYSIASPLSIGDKSVKIDSEKKTTTVTETTTKQYGVKSLVPAIAVPAESNLSTSAAEGDNNIGRLTGDGSITIAAKADEANYSNPSSSGLVKVLSYFGNSISVNDTNTKGLLAQSLTELLGIEDDSKKAALNKAVGGLNGDEVSIQTLWESISTLAPDTYKAEVNIDQGASIVAAGNANVTATTMVKNKLDADKSANPYFTPYNSYSVKRGFDASAANDLYNSLANTKAVVNVSGAITGKNVNVTATAFGQSSQDTAFNGGDAVFNNGKIESITHFLPDAATDNSIAKAIKNLLNEVHFGLAVADNSAVININEGASLNAENITVNANSQSWGVISAGIKVTQKPTEEAGDGMTWLNGGIAYQNIKSNAEVNINEALHPTGNLALSAKSYIYSGNDLAILKPEDTDSDTANTPAYLNAVVGVLQLENNAAVNIGSKSEAGAASEPFIHADGKVSVAAGVESEISSTIGVESSDKEAVSTAVSVVDLQGDAAVNVHENAVVKGTDVALTTDNKNTVSLTTNNAFGGEDDSNFIEAMANKAKDSLFKKSTTDKAKAVTASQSESADKASGDKVGGSPKTEKEGSSGESKDDSAKEEKSSWSEYFDVGASVLVFNADNKAKVNVEPGAAIIAQGNVNIGAKTWYNDPQYRVTNVLITDSSANQNAKFGVSAAVGVVNTNNIAEVNLLSDAKGQGLAAPQITAGGSIKAKAAVDESYQRLGSMVGDLINDYNRLIADAVALPEDLEALKTKLEDIKNSVEALATAEQKDLTDLSAKVSAAINYINGRAQDQKDLYKGIKEHLAAFGDTANYTTMYVYASAKDIKKEDSSGSNQDSAIPALLSGTIGVQNSHNTANVNVGKNVQLLAHDYNDLQAEALQGSIIAAGKLNLLNITDVQNNQGAKVGLGGTVAVQNAYTNSNVRVESGAKLQGTRVNLIAANEVMNAGVSLAGSKSTTLGLTGMVTYMGGESNAKALVDDDALLEVHAGTDMKTAPKAAEYLRYYGVPEKYAEGASEDTIRSYNKAILTMAGYDQDAIRAMAGISSSDIAIMGARYTQKLNDYLASDRCKELVASLLGEGGQLLEEAIADYTGLGSVNIKANNNTILTNVVGNITSSEVAAIGASVGVISYDVHSQAKITELDDVSDAQHGHIYANALNVAAVNEGIINNLTVAGSTSSKKQEADKTEADKEAEDKTSKQSGTDIKVRDKDKGTDVDKEELSNRINEVSDEEAANELWDMALNTDEESGSSSGTGKGRDASDDAANELWDMVNNTSQEEEKPKDASDEAANELWDMVENTSDDPQETKAEAKTAEGDTSDKKEEVKAEDTKSTTEKKKQDTQVQLAAAGSVSWNDLDVKTEAELSDMTVTLRNFTYEQQAVGRSTITDKKAAVTANDNTYIGAYSGAMALAKGGKAPDNETSFSGTLAGAAAVNDLTKNTSALIKYAQITNATSVENMAMNEGAQVAAGLSLGLATTKSVGVNVAGSVSVNMIDSDVKASIENSTIDSASGAANASLGNIAYDKDVQVAGGVNVNVAKVSASIGAAVTVNTVHNDIAATLVNSDIGKNSAFGSVDNLALSKLQQVGAAVSVGVASGDKSAAVVNGAVAVNNVHNNVQAIVYSGDSGKTIRTKKFTTEAKDGKLEAGEEDNRFSAQLEDLGMDVDGSEYIKDYTTDLNANDGAGGLSYSSNTYDTAHSGNTIVGAAISAAVKKGASNSPANVTAAAGVAYSYVNNSFKAGVGGGKIIVTGNDNNADTASLKVNAASDTSMVDVAAGVAVATGQKGLALAGSGVVNSIHNDTLAAVSNAVLQSSDDIEVNAATSSKLIGIAGQVSLTAGAGGWGAGGLSWAQNKQNSTTMAAMSNVTASDTASKHNDKLKVRANNASDALAIGVAVGVSTSGYAGAEGAFAANEGVNNTKALLTADKGITSAINSFDEIAVEAKSKGEQKAVAVNADVVAGKSSYVAAGASVAYNNVGSSEERQFTQAAVTNTKVVYDKDNYAKVLNVKAEDDTELLTLALGGAVRAGSGSGLTAEASVALSNVYKDTNTLLGNTDIEYRNNTSINYTKAEANILSTNSSKVINSADTLGVSAGGSGVSIAGLAAVAVNTIAADTSAFVVEGSHLVKRETVKALAEDDLLNVGLGLGVGASGSGLGVTVAGNVAVNAIKNDVYAIVDGTTAKADEDFAVQADSKDRLRNYGGALSLSAGQNAVGVGATVVVNTINGNTMANVSNSNLQADALGSETIAVKYHEFEYEADTKEAKGTAAQKSRNVKGIVVTANADHELENIAVTAGLTAAASAAVAVDGTVAVNTISGMTNASLYDTAISSRKDANVIADDVTTLNTHIGTLGVAVGSAGITAGAAVDTNTMKREVAAEIRNKTAKGLTAADVNVYAMGAQQLTLSESGLSVSAGNVGVGATGVVSINDFAGSVLANVVKTVGTVRNLTVDAERAEKLTSYANGAGAAFGADAVAASVAFVQLEDTSRVTSSLKNSNLEMDNTEGTVAVLANNNEKVSGEVGAGALAVGLGGAAGVTIGLNELNNRVTAEASGNRLGSAMKQLKSLDVLANNNLKVDFYNYAASAGLVAAGVGVGINKINTGVSAAAADNSAVYAKNITIAADEARSLEQLTIGASLSFAGAVTTNVMLNNIGSVVADSYGTGSNNSDENYDMQGINQMSKDAAKTQQNTVGSLEGNRYAADAVKDKAHKAVEQGVTGGSVTNPGVQTSISNSHLYASQELDISSTAKTAVNQDVVQASIGWAAVNVSVGSADVRDNLGINIQGSELKGKTIKLNSTLDSDVTTSNYQVGAGVASVNAAVSKLAHGGENKITVNNSTLEATMSSADAAAQMAEDEDFTSLAIKADSKVDLHNNVYGASVGGFAGGVLYADTEDNGSVNVNVSKTGAANTAKLKAETIAIGAKNDPSVNTQTIGANVGLASGGASIAKAKASGKAEINVGQGMTFDTQLLDITAMNGAVGGDRYTTLAEVKAVSAGLFLGIDVNKAYTENAMKALVNVGANNYVEDKTNLGIVAINGTKTHADIYGVNVGGLIASGSNFAETKNNNETSVSLVAAEAGKTADLASLTLYASDSENVKATANGDGGGIIDISPMAAQVDNTSASTTTTTLKGNVNTQGRVYISAVHGTDANFQANATRATLAGGSGTGVNNKITNTTTVNVTDAQISNANKAENVNITATNTTSLNKELGSMLNGNGYGGISVTVAEVKNIIEDTAKVNITNSTVETLGRMNLAALTTEDLKTHAYVDSAGVFEVTNLKLNNKITTNDNITIAGSTLRAISAGSDLNLSAADDAYLDAYANAETSIGLAGATTAILDNEYRRNNTIDVKAYNTKNSSLYGAQDVRLYAGKHINDKLAKVDLNLDATVFNGNLIPISSDPSLSLKLYENNSIDVASGSGSRSVRHTYGYADSGSEIIRTAVGMYEWLSDDKDFQVYSSTMKGLTPGVAHDSPYTRSNTNGLHNDGEIVAGVGNKINITIGAANGQQEIVLPNYDASSDIFKKAKDEFVKQNINLVTAKDVTVTIDADPSIGLTRDKLTFGTEDYGQALINRYSELLNLKEAYSDNEDIAAGYQTEINRVKEQMAAEGITFVEVDGKYLAATTRAQDYVEIPELVASGGNLYIDSRDVYGSGKLIANGTPEITINNNTQLAMKLNTITMDEPGGKFIYNETPLLGTNTAEFNAQLTQYNVSQQAGFKEVKAATGSAGTINVNGNYNGAKSYSYTAEIDGVKKTAILPAKADIYVQGGIWNQVGRVNISSKNDSIYIQGKTASEGVSINAADISLMAASGSISQGYTSGIVNIGSSPQITYRSKLQEVITDYSVSNLNKLATEARPELVTSATRYFSDNTSDISDGATGSQSWIAGNSIYINAADINVNGTLQSGFADYYVNVDADARERIDFLDTYYSNRIVSDDEVTKGVYGDIYKIVKGAPVYNKDKGCFEYQMTAYYNPSTKNIIVEDVNASGGRIYLTGRISNTASGGANDAKGQIICLDGVSDITAQNMSERTLKVGNLITEDNAGFIQITDPNKKVNSKTPVYKYVKNGLYIYESADAMNDEGYRPAYITSTGRIADSNGKKFTDDVYNTYKPQAGLYYNWTNGVSMTSGTRTAVENNRRWVIEEWGTGSVEDATKNGGNRPNGEYIGSSNGASGTAENPYSIVYKSVSKESTLDLQNLVYIDGGLWDDDYIYFEFVKEQGVKDSYASSVKADRPISINFIGNTEGNVSVTSIGDIKLNGDVGNRKLYTETNNGQTSHVEKGSVNVISLGGSIEQTNGSLYGANVNLGAVGDIKNINIVAGDNVNLNAVNLATTVSAGEQKYKYYEEKYLQGYNPSKEWKWIMSEGRTSTIEVSQYTYAAHSYESDNNNININVDAAYGAKGDVTFGKLGSALYNAVDQPVYEFDYELSNRFTISGRSESVGEGTYSGVKYTGITRQINRITNYYPGTNPKITSQLAAGKTASVVLTADGDIKQTDASDQIFNANGLKNVVNTNQYYQKIRDAKQSIQPADTPYTSNVLVADKIDLISRNGSITDIHGGNIDILAGRNPVNGDSISASFNASAYGDIKAKQYNWDLRVGTVHSKNGDVVLTANSGGIVDALPYVESNQESTNALLEKWASMGIIDDGTNRAVIDEKQQVLARENLERGIKNNYAYMLKLQGKASRTADENTRLDELEKTFAGFDSAEAYIASEQVQAKLSQTGYVAWDKDALLYAISDSIINPDASSLNTSDKTPNILGKNIYLDVRDSVGLNTGNSTVVTMESLKNGSEDRLNNLKLLAGADATMVSVQRGQAGNNVITSFTISDVLPVGVEMLSDSANKPLGALNIISQPNIYTNRANGANIYIEGRMQDHENGTNTALALGKIETDIGNVIIKSIGDILDAHSTTDYAVAGNNIYLASKNGVIGAADKPLAVNAASTASAKGYVAAIAAGDIYLEQNTDNDLYLRNISSGGNIGITAQKNMFMYSADDEHYTDIFNKNDFGIADEANTYVRSLVDGSITLTSKEGSLGAPKYVDGTHEIASVENNGIRIYNQGESSTGVVTLNASKDVFAKSITTSSDGQTPAGRLNVDVNIRAGNMENVIAVLSNGDLYVVDDVDTGAFSDSIADEVNFVAMKKLTVNSSIKSKNVYIDAVEQVDALGNITAQGIYGISLSDFNVGNDEIKPIFTADIVDITAGYSDDEIKVFTRPGDVNFNGIIKNTTAGTVVDLKASDDVNIGTAITAKELHAYSGYNVLIQAEGEDADANINVKGVDVNVDSAELTSVNNIYVSDSQFSAAAANLQAKDNIEIDTSEITSTALDIAAEKNVQIADSSVEAESTELTAGENILVNNGQIAVGTINMLAGNDVKLQQGVLQAVTSADITATAGSILELDAEGNKAGLIREDVDGLANAGGQFSIKTPLLNVKAAQEITLAHSANELGTVNIDNPLYVAIGNSGSSDLMVNVKNTVGKAQYEAWLADPQGAAPGSDYNVEIFNYRAEDRSLNNVQVNVDPAVIGSLYVQNYEHDVTLGATDAAKALSVANATLASAKGNVHNYVQLTSDDSVTLSAGVDVTNNKAINAVNAVSFTAERNIINSGAITADKVVTLNAGSYVDNSAAINSTNGNTTITAGSYIKNAGAIAAGNNKKAGNIFMTAGSAEAADNTAATIENTAELSANGFIRMTAYGNDIVNADTSERAAITNTGKLKIANDAIITAAAGSIKNTVGIVGRTIFDSPNNVEFTAAKNIINVSGTADQENIRASYIKINQTGADGKIENDMLLQSKKGPINIKAAESITNRGQILAFGGNAEFTAGTFIDNSGTLYASTNATLEAGSYITNSGSMKADFGNITVTAGTQLTNSGSMTISSTGNIAVTAGRFENQETGDMSIQGDGNINIETANDILNSGDMTIGHDGDIVLHSGLDMGAAGVAYNGDTYNHGLMSIGNNGDITVTAAEDIRNTGNFKITNDGNISMTAVEDLVNYGSMNVGKKGDISIAVTGHGSIYNRDNAEMFTGGGNISLKNTGVYGIWYYDENNEISFVKDPAFIKELESVMDKEHAGIKENGMLAITYNGKVYYVDALIYNSGDLLAMGGKISLHSDQGDIYNFDIFGERNIKDESGNVTDTTDVVDGRTISNADISITAPYGYVYNTHDIVAEKSVTIAAREGLDSFGYNIYAVENITLKATEGNINNTSVLESIKGNVSLIADDGNVINGVEGNAATGDIVTLGGNVLLSASGKNNAGQGYSVINYGDIIATSENTEHPTGIGTITLYSQYGDVRNDDNFNTIDDNNSNILYDDAHNHVSIAKPESGSYNVAAGSIVLSAREGTVLNNKHQLVSLGSVTLEAKQGLDSFGDIVYAGEGIKLVATDGNLVNKAQLVSAKGDITLEAEKGTVVNMLSGDILALGGNVTLHAGQDTDDNSVYYVNAANGTAHALDLGLPTNDAARTLVVDKIVNIDGVEYSVSDVATNHAERVINAKDLENMDPDQKPDIMTKVYYIAADGSKADTGKTIEGDVEVYRKGDVVNRGDIVALGQTEEQNGVQVTVVPGTIRLVSDHSNVTNFDNFVLVDGAEQYELKGTGIFNSDTALHKDTSYKLYSEKGELKVTGNLSLEAEEGYFYNNFNIVTNGDLVIKGQNDIIIGTNFNADLVGGNLIVTSTEGKVISKGDELAAGNDIILQAAEGIEVQDKITAGGGVNIDSAEGNVILQGDITSAAGGLTVQADGGSVAATGDMFVALDVFLNAGEDVTNSGTINAGGDAAIAAGGDVTNSGAVNAGGDAAITSGEDVTNSGTINAGGDAAITAGGDVTNSAAVNAGGEAAITSGGDLTNTNTVVAGDNLSMQSGAAIYNEGGLQAVRGDVLLSAVNDINNNIQYDNPDVNAGVYAGNNLLIASQQGSIHDQSTAALVAENAVVVGAQGTYGSDSIAFTSKVESLNGSINIVANNGNVKTGDVIADQGLAAVSAQNGDVNVGYVAADGKTEILGTIRGQNVVLHSGAANGSISAANIDLQKSLVIEGDGLSNKLDEQSTQVKRYYKDADGKIVYLADDGYAAISANGLNNQAMRGDFAVDILGNAYFDVLNVTNAEVESSGELLFDKLHTAGIGHYTSNDYKTVVFGANIVPDNSDAAYYDLGYDHHSSGKPTVLDMKALNFDLANPYTGLEAISKTNSMLNGTRAGSASKYGDNDGWMNLYIYSSDYQTSNALLLHLGRYHYAGAQRYSLEDAMGFMSDTKAIDVYNKNYYDNFVLFNRYNLVDSIDNLHVAEGVDWESLDFFKNSSEDGLRLDVQDKEAEEEQKS